jgi:hypothetical protein
VKKDMQKTHQRISRINQIKAVIKKSTESKRDCVKEKLIANLCCEWGTSRRTSLEYVDTIIKAGFAKESVEDDEKILVWVGK